MQPKTPEKKSDSSELEKTFSPILVASNSKLKPYLELFEFYPENINLQPLGAMLGFFKITDRSEDSAYIVNFLASVLKKEYYANPKRPVSESFDAALHKLNLALAEIAKNGNIRWIGQLDAAVCIFEKNFLHFTVCGAGQILLLRSQNISDIGKDLNPGELEPNPLKTFSNVSSGYLEKDDKLIITSSDLFNIFSLNELRKGSSRFDREKFVQFLRTAMNNELESGATIVADLSEPLQEVPEPAARKRKKKEEEPAFNAWSGKAFEKPVIDPSDLKDKSQTDEYTDERTGHIYVQGNDELPQEDGFWSRFSEWLADQSSDLYHWSRRRLYHLGVGMKSLARWIGHESVQAKKYVARKIAERKQQKETARRSAEARITGSETGPSESPIGQDVATYAPPEEIRSGSDPEPSGNEILLRLRGKMGLLKNIRLLPNFSRIGAIFSRLSYPQKMIALSVLLVIFFAPLAYSRISRKAPAPTPDLEKNQPAPVNPLLQDKNIREARNVSAPTLAGEAEQIILIRDKVFAITRDKVTALENGQPGESFSFSEKISSVTAVFPMDDLNLIFLFSSSGKIVSFSPVSKQFKDNSLGLPDNFSFKGAGTYLTYLYLADEKSGQLYRYPRAADGFGEKTAWLKDPLDLSKLKDLAIEENIFLALGNDVQKFFRGAPVNFAFEKPTVPLTVSKLYTGPNLSNLYVLDAENGRVLRYSKDGKLLDQYYDSRLKNATSFAVDEKNNKTYFIASKSLYSFEM